MADQPKIIISAVDNTRAAFSSVKSGLGQIESTGSTLNGVIGRLAPLLGAATFTAFLKGGIDTLDMLGDLSDRTGVAASTLSGFQLVAAQSDTSLEALGKGLNKLSIYMAENGEAAAKLGITAKDPAEAFLQLSNVLTGIENPQQRAALANKILGKSYQELLPALLQGGDALRDQIEKGREYSGVTEESVTQAQAFNDQFDELKVAAGGFGTKLATDVLPALNDIIKAMKDAYTEGGLMKSFFMGLGTLGKNVLFGSDAEAKRNRAMQAIPNEINELATKLRNDINGSKPLSFVDRKQIELDIQYLAKEANSLKKELGIDQPESSKPKVTGANSTAEDVINPSGKPKSSKDTAEVAKEAASEYAKLYGEFTKIIDGTNQLTQAEQALRDIQSGKFSDLLPWQQEQLAGLAREVQAMNDLQVFNEGEVRAVETEIELQNEKYDIEQKLQEQQQLAVDAYDKILQGIQDETAELEFQLSLQGLSEKSQQEKIAARNVEIQLQETLNQLAEAGLGLSEEEIIALREKYTELSTLNSKIKENKSTGADLGLTFKSAFEDAIVKGEDLGDVIDSLGEDIMRIATRRMFTDPLMGAVDSFLGSIDFSAFIPGITANADGGVYSSPSLSAYSGSVVTQPTMFAFANGAGVMGEAGAEGIFPLKRGKDGKLGVSVSGSNNNATNVIVNLIESPGNGGQVNQKSDGNNLTIDVMVEKIESTIGRNISQGRGLAPVMERQYGLNRAAGAY